MDMLTINSVVMILYYFITTFFLLAMVRNFIVTRDVQEALLYAVVMIPLFARSSSRKGPKDEYSRKTHHSSFADLALRSLDLFLKSIWSIKLSSRALSLGIKLSVTAMQSSSVGDANVYIFSGPTRRAVVLLGGTLPEELIANLSLRCYENVHPFRTGHRHQPHRQARPCTQMGEAYPRFYRISTWGKK